jgi:hypothetical protein
MIETKNIYPKQGIKLHEMLLIIMSVVVLGIGVLKLQAFSPPLGSDALIIHWPMGKALTEAEDLSQVISLLFSKYMGEDLIWPLHNGLAYFVYQFGSAPVSAVKMLSIILVTLTIFMMATSVFWLWRDWLKVGVFVVCLSSNIALIGDNVIAPTHLFGIFLCTCSFCMFCYALRRGSKKGIYVSVIMLISATLASVSSFIAIPLMLVLINFLPKKGEALCSRTIQLRLSFVMLLSCIPYMASHYIVFETFLPGSRIDGVAHYSGPGTESLSGFLNHFPVGEAAITRTVVLGKTAFMLLSNWFFGLFRAAYDHGGTMLSLVVGFVSVLLGLSIRMRVVSRYGIVLAVGLLISCCGIIYTARFGAGIWMFPGMIANLIFADILTNSIRRLDIGWQLNRKRVVQVVAPFLMIPVFAVANSFANPWSIYKNDFRGKERELEAAYIALNEPIKKLILIRMPDSRPTHYSPFQFWMGNQMFHGKDALVWFKDQNEMFFKDAYVESYFNYSGMAFKDLARPITKLVSKSVAVIVETNNLVARLYGQGMGRKIFRAGVIEGRQARSFDIYFPDLAKKYHVMPEIEFILQYEEADPDVREVLFNGASIEFASIGSKVKFTTKNYDNDNILEVKTSDRQNRLIYIEGQAVKFDEIETDNKLGLEFVRISAPDEPWRIFIKPDEPKGGNDWYISSTISIGDHKLPKPLSMLLGETGLVRLRVVSLEPHNGERFQYSQVIQGQSYTELELKR